MIAPATKTCVHCNIEKPLDEFYTSKKTRFCKICYRAKEAALWRWRYGKGPESEYRAFCHRNINDGAIEQCAKDKSDPRAWDRRMQRLDALAARIWRESGGLYGWPGPLDRPREMAFEIPSRQRNTKEQCNV